MIFFAEILLIAVNVWMAWYHSRLIQKGIRIKHGFWAAGWLIFSTLLSIVLQSWVLMVASLFIRKVVFDLSLNLFREKPLFYVSSSTTSIIDRVHNWLFGNRGEIYYPIYFVSIILINILWVG